MKNTNVPTSATTASVMDQRHQIFVIARAGQYYRSLATVHQEWLYGQSALRQCLLILHIFSHPENRLALQQELRFADEYFRNKGAPSSQRPKLEWDMRGVCPFPFITTCLMMGASLNTETSHASVVEEDPFGMAFDQGGYKNGITIIDITDLASVKYCFVNFARGFSFSAQENKIPLFQPLTGWEYVLNYYPPGDPQVQRSIHLPEALEKKPLVDIAALAEAWPWGKWEIGDSAPQSTGEHVPRRFLKGLVEKSMQKIVETILVSDDLSDFNNAKDHLEALPRSQSILKDILLSRANEVGKTQSSLLLLALAYAGEHTLDWAPFTRLDVTGLQLALEAGSFSSVKTLNLSGTRASRSLYELSPIISILPALETLCLLDKPDRSDDISTSKTALRLTSSSPYPKLNRILVSGLLSMPIRGRLWFPDESSPQNVMPGFPATQLLVYHKSEQARMQVAPYECFFLGDALLSPGRLVTSLLRYLRLLVSHRYAMTGGTGYQLATCIATAASDAGSHKVGEIGALPAEAYTFGKKRCNSISRLGTYSDMRNLSPGQWTILMAKNSYVPGYYSQGDYFDKGFRYAFVRCKSEVPVRPSGGGPVKVNEKDLDVFSFHGFLQETRPGNGSTDLEPLFSQLRAQVASPENPTPEIDDVVRCMDVKEACDLLVKFIENIPCQDRLKKDADGSR